MSEAPAVDWAALRSAALDAAQRAHAPYSGLRVGAAGLTDTGDMVAGCNVENVSFGLSLCAECVLAGNLRLAGSERLVAVACVDGDGRPLAPCGRCRQILLEHGGPRCLVAVPSGVVTVADLLPGAFTTEDLP